MERGRGRESSASNIWGKEQQIWKPRISSCKEDLTLCEYYWFWNKTMNLSHSDSPNVMQLLIFASLYPIIYKHWRREGGYRKLWTRESFRPLASFRGTFGNINGERNEFPRFCCCRYRSRIPIKACRDRVCGQGTFTFVNQAPVSMHTSLLEYWDQESHTTYDCSPKKGVPDDCFGSVHIMSRGWNDIECAEDQLLNASQQPSFLWPVTMMHLFDGGIPGGEDWIEYFSSTLCERICEKQKGTDLQLYKGRSSGN